MDSEHWRGLWRLLVCYYYLLLVGDPYNQRVVKFGNLTTDSYGRKQLYRTRPPWLDSYLTTSVLLDRWVNHYITAAAVYSIFIYFSTDTLSQRNIEIVTSFCKCTRHKWHWKFNFNGLILTKNHTSNLSCHFWGVQSIFKIHRTDNIKGLNFFINKLYKIMY